MSAHKIPSDAGRTALILLAVEDVTERNLSALRLKEADLRKDEFLAMLAHELRNPLAPITHAMHLLRHSGPRLEPSPLYDLIERQTQRLVRLVDDLLDVARVTRGHIALKLEAVNLPTLVGATVEAYRARVEERGHTLTVELSEAPLEVDGDPIRLEQVVSSLLENAIKYTEPGGRIAVSLREEGSEVILRVRDSGIGIRAQDLEAIFDLFTQLNTSLARTGGGLGIGLTVARRLVMLHGGRIEVLSAGLGHGSEFIIHLPRRAAALARPDSTEDQTPPVTDVPSSRRVLIVDDNADRVDSLALLVRTWGHEVTTARDAPTALTVAENFEPDVALLDIGLPGINGYDLARRLRDATHRRPLHLVAMTGYGREEDRRAAQDASFEVDLVKRPDIDAIRKLLAALR